MLKSARTVVNRYRCSLCWTLMWMIVAILMTDFSPLEIARPGSYDDGVDVCDIIV